MSLEARIKSAFRWGAGLKMTGQIFTWAMTIVVIRLLSPEDYGLMAMSVLFVQFLMLVNELGLGAVLVQRSDLDTGKKRQIFGLILTINTVFFALLFAAAPAIAAVFEEEQLTLMVRVLAFQFIISAFEIVPIAHLERNLDFKTKSLIYLGASVMGGILTLLLALEGYGVWSLIWGNMLVLSLQTIGVNIVCPFRHLPIFSLKNMREIASFGGLVTLERAMWFLYTRSDVFIVGKLLGKDLLGVYSVAMHLASLIMHKTGGLIYEIAFPSFVLANEETDKVATYFLKAVRIVSFITFPLFIGMSSVAPELVAVLLGDRWEMAGGVLEILCLVMPLRMISNLLPPALQGIGRPDASVSNLVVAIIAMPLAFFVGTHWGVMGVSVAWVIAYPVVFLVIISRSAPILGVSLRQLVNAAAKPAIMSAAMYAGIMYVKSIMGMGEEAAHVERLVVSIIVGIAVYSTASWVIHREGLKEVLQLARR